MPRTPQTLTREATDGDTSSRSSLLRNPLVSPACSATAARVRPARVAGGPQPGPDERLGRVVRQRDAPDLTRHVAASRSAPARAATHNISCL